MAIILCIETTSSVCSVCLVKNGNVLALKETDDFNSHSKLVNEFIDDVLSLANYQLKDVEAVSISAGPGSYTGLRIGLSTAKGLCYGLGIPLIAISTLKIMSFAAIKEYKTDCDLLIPMIDARRMEVFMGVYNSKLQIYEEEKPLILNENSLEYLSNSSKYLVFGSGSQKAEATIKGENFKYWKRFKISSKYQAQLAENDYLKGNFKDVAYFEPSYIKPFFSVKNAQI